MRIIRDARSSSCRVASPWTPRRGARGDRPAGRPPLRERLLRSVAVRPPCTCGNDDATGAPPHKGNSAISIVPASIEEQINSVDPQRSRYVGIGLAVLAAWSAYPPDLGVLHRGKDPWVTAGSLGFRRAVGCHRSGRSDCVGRLLRPRQAHLTYLRNETAPKISPGAESTLNVQPMFAPPSAMRRTAAMKTSISSKVL